MAAVGWLLGSRAIAWNPAVNVSNQPSGARAFGPRIVRDHADTLHVVWTGGSDPSTSWRVKYQSYSGGAWSGIEDLSGPNGTRPDVAVDAGDVLHVCYEEAAEKNIWYRRRTPSGWSERVNLRSGGRSIASRIAVDPAGTRMLVAWHEDGQVGGEWDIGVNVFANGAWSGFQNISQDSALSAWPRVAIDQGGNFHVVWVSDGKHIYYRRLAASGTWGPRTEIHHTSTRGGLGDIAVSPDNVVHVVLQEDSGDGGWEIKHRSLTGTTWSPATNLSNRLGATDDISASIVADASNRLFVVWHDYANVFFSSRLAPGGAWSAAQPIVTGRYSATDPDLAITGGHVSHVVWQSRPTQADNWNIYWSNQPNPLPGPQGTLTGVVLDQYGQPVAEAVVSVGPSTGVTSPNGTYAFLVSPGTYTATARKAFFTEHAVPNVTIVENQTTTVNFSIASLGPSPVVSFNATPGNTFNSLSWQNPSSGQFAGTRIRFRTDVFPSDPEDGVLVGDFAGAPGSMGNFTHANLTNGTNYHYAAFAYDGNAARNYAGATTALATPHGPADYDRDGDVDQSDFGHFQACLTGPSVPQYDPACADTKFDEDVDVDTDDMAVFLGCMTGPGAMADPHCSG
ncbi:MAG: hypothetical protein AMXMBFR13_23480 [Phycisphaerae bacterium]